MRRDKRRWIFEGLLIPPGLAVVSAESQRPRRQALPPRLRILLVSDDERDLAGLGAPLRRMLEPPWEIRCAALGVSFHLQEVERLLGADLVHQALWILPPAPIERRHAVDQLAKRSGVRSRWVSRPWGSALLTARDYAAWAARLRPTLERDSDG